MEEISDEDVQLFKDIVLASRNGKTEPSEHCPKSPSGEHKFKTISSKWDRQCAYCGELVVMKRNKPQRGDVLATNNLYIDIIGGLMKLMIDDEMIDLTSFQGKKFTAVERDLAQRITQAERVIFEDWSAFHNYTYQYTKGNWVLIDIGNGYA